MSRSACMSGRDVSKLRINWIWVAVFCSNLINSYSNSCTLNEINSKGSGWEWSRSCFSKRSTRSSSASIIPVEELLIFDFCRSRSSNWSIPLTPLSGFCISCAREAANVPSARDNCSSCSLAWVSWRVVLSSSVITACFTLPVLFLTGAITISAPRSCNGGVFNTYPPIRKTFPELRTPLIFSWIMTSAWNNSLLCFPRRRCESFCQKWAAESLQ